MSDEAAKEIIGPAISECCGCDRAEEVVDALHHAGFAIVQLPNPGSPRPVLAGGLGIPFAVDDSYYSAFALEGKVPTVYDGEYMYDPREAREFAAALLAAANAAEGINTSPV